MICKIYHFYRVKKISLDEAEIQNICGTITIINKKIMNAQEKMRYLKGLLQKTQDCMHENMLFNNVLAQRRDDLLKN